MDSNVTDEQQVVDYVRLWHGIAPPNAPALRMARQLAEMIEGFERLRRLPDLNAPPMDFARTLLSLADDAG